MNEATVRTVLVVDDDPDIRSIVSSIVAMAGHTVIEAPDGETAIASVKERIPDLIILDLMMPGCSGNEVSAFVKKFVGDHYVPIIMLTARDTIQDKVSALDGGADDYLTKPFNYQELQARINAQLRIRDLHHKLHLRNLELQSIQEKLVHHERQLAVMQLAGTAAHQLGQPLSAIIINTHLLESAKQGEANFTRALGAIAADAKRMADLIQQLRSADAEKIEGYYDATAILDLEKKQDQSQK